MSRASFLSWFVVGSLAASCSSPHPFASTDGTLADEAIAGYVARGESAVPELRLLAADEDPAVRARAKTALGRITGQWGADGSGIVWGRSLDQAIAAEGERPLMLLHLFGNFDEEFC